MIKAVLFDFDGVLTTDATGSESTCKYLAQQAGLPYEMVLGAYRKYNPKLQYGHCTHADIWDEFCDAIGQRLTAQQLYDSFIHTPVDVEMVALARAIKEDGLRTGMITDNKADRMEAIIQYHGWETLFDVVSVSATVGSGKKDQEIFCVTLEALQLPPQECVFIDNSEDNLVQARAVGMEVIWFDDLTRDHPKLYKSLAALGISATQKFL